jgi:hypothetical protein
MIRSFIHCFKSEWLKTRRTTAFWLVVLGGFFIPAILIAIRIINSDKLVALYKKEFFWEALFSQSWQIMAFFLLPMGVILATSLITQIEYRNNTWKQLHTTPQSYTIIFATKLTVILVMLLQFFVLFNLGIYLTGIIPALVYNNIHLPTQPIPYMRMLIINAHFFIDCLPIVAIQLLVALQFKNFMVSLGAGIGLLVASMFAVQWKYGYTIPYTYTTYNFLSMKTKELQDNIGVNIHVMAISYFVVVTLASYVLYIYKREKG